MRGEVLEWRWLEGERTYDGRQLVTHWPREAARLEDDALVGFLGPAEVPTAALVDLVDREQRAVIRAARMLHIIGVFFERPLRETVFRQRLYIARLAEALRERGITLTVRGDDLFLPGDPPRKLSVSIATRSSLAGLIHIGVNDDPAGAPVPAAGLAELGVPAADFGREMLACLAREEEEIRRAAAKVRAVE